MNYILDYFYKVNNKRKTARFDKYIMKRVIVEKNDFITVAYTNKRTNATIILTYNKKLKEIITLNYKIFENQKVKSLSSYIFKEVVDFFYCVEKYYYIPRSKQYQHELNQIKTKHPEFFI